MKLKIRPLLFTALAMLGFALSANAITLTQSVNKTEMAFEDSVQFDVTVEWKGPQFAFRFPHPLNPYIDRLKIGRYSSSISSTGQGKEESTTKKFTYVLEPTSGGKGKIDPITIAYVSWPDSIPGELVTELVMIDIADEVIVAKSSGSILWYFIIGGILLLGGGAGVFIVRNKTAKSKVPVKTPVDAAIEELDNTKAESGSDLKKFQTGIYDLLSNFLKSRYNIDVSGNDEAQLGTTLAKTSLSETQKGSIIKWLVQAERDKFRPIEASPGETVRLENDLRKFFENLKV